MHIGKTRIRGHFPATIAQGGGWEPANQPASDRGHGTPAGGAGDRIDLATLLDGRRSVRIVHADSVYRLSLTRQNKLILTRDSDP